MNIATLPNICHNRFRAFKLLFSLTALFTLLLPGQVIADIIYGSVQGVSQDNLTLIVYKGDKMVTSAAIRSIAKNKYEYRLNLTPGTYKLKYKNKSQTVVNYPGTNRVNIDFK